jgi:hypothetical protein
MDRGMGDTGLLNERRDFAYAGLRLVSYPEGGTSAYILAYSIVTDSNFKVNTIISTPSILSKYRRSSFPNIRVVAVGGELCSQK